jgi:hypothetical protein
MQLRLHAMLPLVQIVILAISCPFQPSDKLRGLLHNKLDFSFLLV